MQGMSENVVEFIRYNKEAIDRCKNILAYYEPNLSSFPFDYLLLLLLIIIIIYYYLLQSLLFT